MTSTARKRLSKHNIVFFNRAAIQQPLDRLPASLVSNPNKYCAFFLLLKPITYSHVHMITNGSSVRNLRLSLLFSCHLIPLPRFELTSEEFGQLGIFFRMLYRLSNRSRSCQLRCDFHAKQNPSCQS